MLEEGGEFVIVIFPKGLVLSQDCSNPLKLYNHYSLSHIKCLWKICCETLYLPVTLCTTAAGRYGVFVKGHVDG